ncbi:molybdate ABC transporter substrate-binding protein [Xanthovirga aplysinae]|uniref:molybdate ABC transporter substrate-binding protein n=1 Tax=Xanthovirga aplysinae TaxID=2529853 RepID=UPI0012BD6ED1|nr:molybdate ABC transporter substrate-binding protein [Xanthovirga aplysinae]MTI33483.1 molybdate ABC transporter substrate-binding protein [Xanthovirga aplysinae]
MSRIVGCILILFFLFSCGHKLTAQKITIAAASNTKYVIDELCERFEEESGIKVEKVYASSGVLATQIVHGAPFNLFIAADTKYPKFLVDKGMALGKPVRYAKGSLILWSFKSIDLTEGLKSLSSAQIERIGIANPRTAPYGALAEEVLEKAELLEKVREKLIYGQNVGQVNHYVLQQNVDVGICPKSVLKAPGLNYKGHWIEVNKGQLEQAMVLTKYGQENNPELGKQLFDFLLSPQAQKIFAAYGYEI